MKSFKNILLSAFALLSSVALWAQSDRVYRIDDIPNVQLQDYRRFVSNPDNILSAEAVERIDTTLLSLKQSGKAQVAVVVVNSIGSDHPRDFIFRLIEKWKVGSASESDGLGIILVLDQGAIEIQTGYGLEGDLPDAILKRIIENYMIPAFRERDFDKGMVDGVTIISEILNGRTPTDIEESDETIELIVALFFFGFIFLIIILVAIFANRCPKCRKRSWRRINTVTFKIGSRKIEETTYVCQKCGYIRKVKRDVGGPGAMGGGMVIGGGGFGGGSRGGGGSWGGGSFGGGGAGGRF